MQAAPGLRVVARHGVGVDDVDLAAAARRGMNNLLGSSAGSIRNELESLARKLNVAV